MKGSFAEYTQESSIQIKFYLMRGIHLLRIFSYVYVESRNG